MLPDFSKNLTFTFPGDRSAPGPQVVRVAEAQGQHRRERRREREQQRGRQEGRQSARDRLRRHLVRLLVVDTIVDQLWRLGARFSGGTAGVAQRLRQHAPLVGASSQSG